MDTFTLQTTREIALCNALLPRGNGMLWKHGDDVPLPERDKGDNRFPKWLYSAEHPAGILVDSEIRLGDLPNEDWHESPTHIGTDKPPFLEKQEPPTADALAVAGALNQAVQDATRIDKRTKAYKDAQ